MTTQIADVTEATFNEAVVARSREVPVVIDFWAAWCGPCRQLSPMLERYAERYADDVGVVKIDVDANPRLAQQFRIQGIPAVKAVKDGRVVAEFTGLQPEAAIAQFFESLAPTKADRLVTAAAGQPPEEAAATLEQALDSDPGHAGALVALARLRWEQGDMGTARQLLERVPGDAAASRLLAEIAIAEDRVDADELGRLESAAAGGDPEARLAYGRALAAAGRHGPAIEELLAAVAALPTREPARAALVELFTTLGDDSALVRDARPRLARALF